MFNFRINDLSHFVQIAHCPTIMEGARKLEISQPALSESIKRLEADLGEILFYRSRTGIKLTPSGRQFLKKAEQAIASLDALKIKDDEKNIFENRSITIGCHQIVAQYSIPKTLVHLKKSAPDYKIELIHDLSRNIQSKVQRGEIDLGIVVNPILVPDLIIHKLSQDLVGVCSHKKTEQLKNINTIICNPQLFQTQSILKKWKGKEKSFPTKIIATDSLELIAELVHEQIGIGILPHKAAELSGKQLKFWDHLPTFKDEIALIYRPEFGKTAAERATINAIKLSLS